jgi:hypothetical protein
MQAVEIDGALTCVWLISKVQVPRKGSVIIELLVGCIEEALASYREVGDESNITQASPSVVTDDVKAFLVSATVISAIDDDCLEVVLVLGGRLTTLCGRSQSCGEKCKHEAGEHWRKVLHLGDWFKVWRRRDVG